MSPGVLVAVEGVTDEPFAARVVNAAGLDVDRTIVFNGHGNLDPRIPKWCQPSNQRLMFVVRDLDPSFGNACPPGLVAHLTGPPPLSATTVVRIAERELEAWLLADRDGVANYFHLRAGSVPHAPDSEPNPKQTLVNLCRSSTSSAIRRGMAPDPRGGRRVGPEFTGLVIDFGSSSWNVERATSSSPSLARALRSLEKLQHRLE
jgi:hypothetical protein